MDMNNKPIAALARKAASLGSIFQIPQLPCYGETEKKRARQEVVRQLSTRNLSLQLGYYVTAEDIDRMKKELAE
jgi:hypothetical protein